jgi:hypothetical protein
MRVPIGIELQSSDVLNEMRLKAVSKERYINNAEVKSCSVSENFRLDSEFIAKYIKSVKVADLDSFIIYDTDNFSNILGFLNDSSVYFVKDKANEFITLSMGSDGGGCIALYCDGKLLSTFGVDYWGSLNLLYNGLDDDLDNFIEIMKALRIKVEFYG